MNTRQRLAQKRVLRQRARRARKQYWARLIQKQATSVLRRFIGGEI